MTELSGEKAREVVTQRARQGLRWVRIADNAERFLGWPISKRQADLFSLEGARQLSEAAKSGVSLSPTLSSRIHRVLDGYSFTFQSGY